MPKVKTVRVIQVGNSSVSTGAAILSFPNVFTQVNTFTGIRVGTRAIGSDFDFTINDFFVSVDTSGGGVTGNLPAAIGSGQFYIAEKIDDSENVVTIAANGSDLIEGSISISLVDQWSNCVLIDAAFGFWANPGLQ